MVSVHRFRTSGEGEMVKKTAMLTGTAVLCALVYVFDWGLKSSGLRIPFIWMPVLRFDFTGVPIALSLFLYGLGASATTSIVALLVILTRGDLVGASMKALAEFSTMFGFALALRFRMPRSISFPAGIIMRTLVMTAANMAVLPVFYKTPWEVALLSIPLIAVFNAMQGFVSLFGGFVIFEALQRRMPSPMLK